MKTANSLKILAAGLITCLSFNTFAGDRDGGGGNAIIAPSLTAKEIKSKLERQEYRWATESVILRFHNASEMTTTDNTKSFGVVDYYANEETKAAYSSLSEKIYYYGIDKIISIIKSTPFNILTDRACIDSHTNQEVDAYANIENNEICFSAYRLSQKDIREADAASILIPLIVHEVTHFFATHDEATILQIYATQHSHGFLNVAMDKEHTLRLAYELQIDIEGIKDRLSITQDLTSFCHDIGYIQQRFKKLTDDLGGNNGKQVYVKKDVIIKASRIFMSLYITSPVFCRPDINNRDAYQNVLDGSSIKGILLPKYRETITMLKNITITEPKIESLIQDLQATSPDAACSRFSIDSVDQVSCDSSTY